MERNLENLLKKYKEGCTTAEEARHVEAWYLSLGEQLDSIDQQELFYFFSKGKEELKLLYS